MVFWHSLSMGRKSLFWWSIAVVFLVLMHLAFYPSIADNAKVWEEITKSLPEALKGFVGANYVSPRGFLQAEFFGSAGFIVLLVFFVGRGASAIAGDEEKGRTELAMASPLSREKYILQRFLALVFEGLILLLVMSASLYLLGPLFDLRAGALSIIAGSGSIVLGTFVFAMAAFFFGAASGKNALSLGAGSALAVGLTLYTLLSPAASFFDDLQFLSPAWQSFAYAPVVSGIRWGNAGILAGEVLVLLLLSLLFYRRRDLR